MDNKKATIGRLRLLPRLFRTEDARKTTSHAAIFLARACRSGLIYRLARGRYVNSFLKGMPSVEEVGCFLKPPAYISCEWALNRHGVLLQAPVVCTVVTLHPAVGRGRTVSYQGVTIEFSRIAPQLFHGYTVQGGVAMANPEKALLDTLYLHRAVPARDELEFEQVNRKVLLDLAALYPATIQRQVSELMGLKET